MEKQTQDGTAQEPKLKVLVPIEESETSNLVIKRSGQFAKTTDCDLTILTVAEDIIHYPDFPQSPLYFKRKEKAEELLEEAENTLKKYNIECKTKLAIGPIAE